MSVFEPFATAGPSVDTWVETPELLPGGVVRGRVCVRGTTRDVVVLRLVVGLVAQAEVENRREGRRDLYGSRLAEVVLAQEFQVTAGEQAEVPFTVPAPWDTPFTTVGGAACHSRSRCGRSWSHYTHWTRLI